MTEQTAETPPTAQGLSPELAAQVAEAMETAPEPVPVKPKTKTVTLDGEAWQIPAQPTVNFLAAVADLQEAEEAKDETRMLIASVAVGRALLGGQFNRFGTREAESGFNMLLEAANKAYGTQGN